MFARRRGIEDGAPPVMMGSHLDTQPNGGRFDGAYGVMAGLEVIRALNDAGAQTVRRSKSPSGPTRKARASCRR